MARFRSEAQAAAALSHPNIVPVYHVGEYDGQAYFCMKFIDGVTLAARLHEGPMPPRDAARVVSDIARAVDHAHQSGILHRDLKPSNVLLDLDDDQPLVTDFGLAKRTQTEPAASRTRRDRLRRHRRHAQLHGPRASVRGKRHRRSAQRRL